MKNRLYDVVALREALREASGAGMNFQEQELQRLKEEEIRADERRRIADDLLGRREPAGCLTARIYIGIPFVILLFALVGEAIGLWKLH